MNIVILAGGLAHRLWPLTIDYPKALLRIAGKPTLYHLLENLSHVPDADNMIIAVDSDKKQYFIDEIDSWNIVSKVKPILSSHSLEKDGSLKGPLRKISEILENSEDLDMTNDATLVVGSDNVFGFPINDFCAFFRDKEKKSCVAIQKFLEPVDSSQFGVPTIDKDGRLTGFIEKPREQKYQQRSTACYIFLPEDICRVKKFLSSGEKDELGKFITWLWPQTELVSYQFQKNWYDIGSRDGILAANAFLMQYDLQKRKEPNITQGKITIIPPVFVDENALLSDSTIGPNVYIESKAVINGSNIQNSIIYKNAKVQGCNLRNSIVGEDSIIEGNISEAIFGPRTRIVDEHIENGS